MRRQPMRGSALASHAGPTLYRTEHPSVQGAAPSACGSAGARHPAARGHAQRSQAASPPAGGARREDFHGREIGDGPKAVGTHQHEDANGSQREKHDGRPGVLANGTANAQGGVNSSRMVAQAGATLKCTQNRKTKHKHLENHSSRKLPCRFQIVGGSDGDRQ